MIENKKLYNLTSPNRKKKAKNKKDKDKLLSPDPKNEYAVPVKTVFLPSLTNNLKGKQKQNP